jgi:hypothetical protein
MLHFPTCANVIDIFVVVVVVMVVFHLFKLLVGLLLVSPRPFKLSHQLCLKSFVL